MLNLALNGWARPQGIGLVKLCTGRENVRALNFWERLGFEVFGQQLPFGAGTRMASRWVEVAVVLWMHVRHAPARYAAGRELHS